MTTLVQWLRNEQAAAHGKKNGAAASHSSAFGSWQAREQAFADVLEHLGADDAFGSTPSVSYPSASEVTDV